MPKRHIGNRLPLASTLATPSVQAHLLQKASSLQSQAHLRLQPPCTWTKQNKGEAEGLFTVQSLRDCVSVFVRLSLTLGGRGEAGAPGGLGLAGSQLPSRRQDYQSTFTKI